MSYLYRKTMWKTRTACLGCLLLAISKTQALTSHPFRTRFGPEVLEPETMGTEWTPQVLQLRTGLPRSRSIQVAVFVSPADPVDGGHDHEGGRWLQVVRSICQQSCTAARPHRQRSHLWRGHICKDKTGKSLVEPFCRVQGRVDQDLCVWPLRCVRCRGCATRCNEVRACREANRCNWAIAVQTADRPDSNSKVLQHLLEAEVRQKAVLQHVRRHAEGLRRPARHGRPFPWAEELVVPTGADDHRAAALGLSAWGHEGQQARIPVVLEQGVLLEAREATEEATVRLYPRGHLVQPGLTHQGPQGRLWCSRLQQPNGRGGACTAAGAGAAEAVGGQAGKRQGSTPTGHDNDVHGPCIRLTDRVA
mmetsp:Transcript_94986/g.295466  ORF Transcript_94986/g.295466 Transcript_94986/m.295466 type:complete len:363 (+) Transcript_94986:128-1216(+)